MDSITTAVQDPSNPDEPISLTSELQTGETFDALILRHANDLAALRAALLPNPLS